MELFNTVLFLLVAIIISNVLGRYIPQVPTPLIQISLGMIYVLLPVGMRVIPENELFMVLFVAPILFYDAKHVSRREFFGNIRSVLLLAFGLVFITVAVMGNFIHWLIPAIPIAAAFALASILSPTDAVAISSLEGRINIPHRSMLFLEGEALVNDASGLVAFNFAVTAVITGTFSLKEASVSFLIIAFGGVLTGLIASFLIIHFGFWIRKQGMEDATVHMLIQILTPFLLYLLAEEFGVSGVLSVVAGGIVYGASKNWTEPATSQLKTISSSTWTVITFVLNGLVFLILGTQIPEILSILREGELISDAHIIFCILIIYVTLIMLRFTFVMIFWNHNYGKKEDSLKEKIKGAAVLSISAVRGAVTLAAALSIPLYMASNEPFPARDLILLIAAGVILCSLIICAIVLPILLPKKESGLEDGTAFEKRILNRLIHTAIKAVMQKTDEANEMASRKVRTEFEYLKQPIVAEDIRHGSSPLSVNEMVDEIINTGKQAEIEMLERLYTDGELTENLYKRLKDEVENRRLNKYGIHDKQEDKKRIFKKNINIFKVVRTVVAFWNQRQELVKINHEQGDIVNSKNQLAHICMKTSGAAITAIEKHINDINHTASIIVIRFYHDRIRRFQINDPVITDENDYYEKIHDLRMEGIQAARDEAQKLFEDKEISRELLHKLRKSISTFETAIMEQNLME